MKPSVAICFAGLPRLNTAALPQWKQFIVENDADVFIHTWSTDLNSADQLRSQIAKEFNPRLCMIESLRKFNIDLYKDSDRIWPYRSHPGTVLSMWYSIGESIGLCDRFSQHSKKRYDIICRARFDWWFEDMVLETRPGLTVPDDPGLSGHRFVYDGLQYIAHNDQFGYGSPAVMNIYARTYSEIPHLFIQDRIDFCSELFLTANMLKHQIPVYYQMDMKYRIAR